MNIPLNHWFSAKALFTVSLCFFIVSCAEGEPEEEQGSAQQLVLTKGDVQSRSSVEAVCGSLLEGFSLAIDSVLPANHQPNLALPPKYKLTVEPARAGATAEIVGKLETRISKDELTTSFLSQEQIAGVCQIIQTDWKNLTNESVEAEFNDHCNVELAGDQLVGAFVQLESSLKELYILRWGLDLLVETCIPAGSHTAMQSGVNSFLDIVSK